MIYIPYSLLCKYNIPSLLTRKEILDTKERITIETITQIKNILRNDVSYQGLYIHLEHTIMFLFESK